MRLVLLGPPGAGKGTQATRIAERCQVPHISTGDIFRENARGGTELGQEAQAYMDRGDLVPDDVVNRMVSDRLMQADAGEGWLLDGYPRTVGQAEWLDELLAGRRTPLTLVLNLEVPVEELTQRIAKRAEEEGRTDDSETAVRQRLQEYHRKTAPLGDFYRDRSLLRDVDAVGAVDEVTERLFAVLDGVGQSR